jgi:hypothetical protein
LKASLGTQEFVGLHKSRPQKNSCCTEEVFQKKIKIIGAEKKLHLIKKIGEKNGKKKNRCESIVHRFSIGEDG